MGRVVRFSEIAAKPAGEGIKVGPITIGDTKEFAAEHVRIEPGCRWCAAAPKGSDNYIFSIKGGGSISAASIRKDLPEQTFATIQEGVGFEVTNTGKAPLELLNVITPVKADGKHAGFTGKMEVTERSKTEIIPVPEQHKKRIYFCGHQHGAHTERGHAMIVVYDKQTYTALHHHPNAESMFVLLDGACEFTVNGKRVVVGPGEATYFTMNDKHGLHTAPGHTGASFLEFHIPAAFTTVKEQK
jgi:quercetin dioxygenase-like cupin family protein